MMNENTHKLNSYPNSDAIKEYATAYILSSETQPITKKDGKFIPIPNKIKGKTINQLKKGRVVRENYDNMISKSEFIPVTTIATRANSSYSVSKSVSYAKKYATSRNRNFENFTYNCTNFVSQAVNAGGKSQNAPSNLKSKSQAYVTSSYWYNKWIDVGAGLVYRKEPRYSTRWTGVIDFHGYWKSKGAAILNYSSMSSLQNAAQLGDIVQLKGSKGWYHSIIITGGSKGNWKYCGNSSNRKDYPLSKATASSYRIIRIR